MACCSKTRKWHSGWHKQECCTQSRENNTLKPWSPESRGGGGRGGRTAGGGGGGRTQQLEEDLRKVLITEKWKKSGSLVWRKESRITILKHGKVSPELWIVSNYLKLHHDFSQDFKKIFLIRRKEKHWKSLPKDKDKLLEWKLHQVKGLRDMFYKYLLELTTA